MAKVNIFRRFATVINLSSAEGKIQAVSSTGTADWVEDGDPIPESADTFTQFLVKLYKLASLVKLNRSFVTDMNFNLEKYLMGDFAKRFGTAEENAYSKLKRLITVNAKSLSKLSDSSYKPTEINSTSSR